MCGEPVLPTRLHFPPVPSCPCDVYNKETFLHAGLGGGVLSVRGQPSFSEGRDLSGSSWKAGPASVHRSGSRCFSFPTESERMSSDITHLTPRGAGANHPGTGSNAPVYMPSGWAQGSPCRDWEETLCFRISWFFCLFFPPKNNKQTGPRPRGTSSIRPRKDGPLMGKFLGEDQSPSAFVPIIT